jgi:hypothetical protein
VTESKVITGHEFLLRLADAGIINHDENIHRVVIDASVDDALRVEVHRWGDDRLLHIVDAFSGAQVQDWETAS